MKTIAAVIPVLNDPIGLRACVSNLINQDPLLDQIIIVDDGSRDSTPQVIRELEDRYPEIKGITHVTNRGVPAAINTGIAATTCSHVFFPAVGDQVLSGFTHVVHRDFPGQGLFLTTGVWRDWRGLEWSMGRMADRKFTMPSEMVDEFSQKKKLRVLSHTAVMNVEQLRAIGGYPEDLHWFADWWVSYKMAFQHGFTFLPTVFSIVNLAKEGYSTRGIQSRDNDRVLASLLGKLQQDPRFLDQCLISGILGDFGLGFAGMMMTNGVKVPMATWKSAAVRSAQVFCRRFCPTWMQRLAIKLFV